MSAPGIQTKIIWSIEQSLADHEIEATLSRGGIDGLRLAYPGGDGAEFVDLLKRLSGSKRFARLAIPLMIDLSQCNKTTVCSLNRSADLVFGEEVSIGFEGEVEGGEDLTIRCLGKRLDIKNKDNIFIGYGACILTIHRVNKGVIKAEVLQGGRILVGMDVRHEVKREPKFIDIDDLPIKLFKGCDVDCLIIPGMLRVRDVEVLRKKICESLGSDPWLFLRIDHASVVDNLSGLIPAIDGVLVSRGELAMSMEAASVPMVSKELIRDCHNNAKVVMLASDLLSSMRSSPTPTRAEVSDVANAVIDGTDAVVLAEDLTKGPWAESALEMCQKIIADIELKGFVEVNWNPQPQAIVSELEAVSYFAYQTAERVSAKAIVCITKEGNTALRLASYQVPLPIIAVTFSTRTQRILSLVRGVKTLHLAVSPSLDEILPLVKERLTEFSWLNQGDRIVFATVTLSSLSHEASNLFTVQKLS